MRYCFVILLLLSMANISYSQEDPNCPGAPSPQLSIGGYGQVSEGDANNVRSLASRDGTKIGEIPAGGTFLVLEGPVCADGFNWWRVDYNGLVGWTVEGTGSDYFVLPVDAPEPTATAEAPIPAITYPLSADNALAVGMQARVDIAGLNIRANPSRSAAMLSQTLENEIVEIVGGSTEADGFVWWQIQQADGTVGWVVEQLRDPRLYQTLFPLCPYTTERISFIAHPYLYTAARDGSQRCVLARLQTASEYTSWGNLKYMVNDAFWSPQGDALIYLDTVSSDFKLYLLSVDGSERRLLTPNNSVSWAEWSPDGSRIALAMSGQAWVMNRDGTNPVRLSDTDNTVEYLAWYPDNQTVFYSEVIRETNRGPQMGRPSHYIFHAVGIDLSNPRVLYNSENSIEALDLSLSPDGRYLFASLFLYTEDGGDLGTDVRLYDTESWELVDLELDRQILWSADSQYIYTTRDEDEGLIISIATGESSSTGRFIAESWSADGQYLYSSQGAGFRVYEIATGEITNYLEAEATYLEAEEGHIDFQLAPRNIREQGTD